MIVPPKGAIHFTSQHGKVKDGVFYAEVVRGHAYIILAGSKYTFDDSYIGETNVFIPKTVPLGGTNEIDFFVKKTICLRGQIKTKEGVPISRINVVLASKQSPNVYSNTNGFFAFKSIKLNEKYKINAYNRRYKVKEKEIVVTTNLVTLIAEKKPDEIQFNVLDEKGRPIKKDLIGWVTGPYSYGFDIHKGKGVLRNLVKGTYKMEIQARTGKMIPVKNNVFQAPVKGNKMSFTLKDKVNVVLSVVDAKTGRGIPNAQIVASQYNVVLEKGKTDQKGKFRLTVWQEKINIRVQSKGYLEFSLKNQKITDQLKITLVRKESIRGIVCNENQEPIPNIPVVCLGSKTGERGVLTDSKGRFEIKGFPNEKVKIIIKKRGICSVCYRNKKRS